MLPARLDSGKQDLLLRQLNEEAVFHNVIFCKAKLFREQPIFEFAELTDHCIRCSYPHLTSVEISFIRSYGGFVFRLPLIG